MSASYIDIIKDMLANSPITWLRHAGIEGEIIEPRHIKLRMPIDGVHTNHVGTAYAGSIFTLAEISGGCLIQAAYGFDEFVPIVKNAAIKYVKPGMTPLTCELSLTEQEAEDRLTPVRERGKGNYPLTVRVLDEEGDAVAEVEFTYYLIPVPSKN